MKPVHTVVSAGKKVRWRSAFIALISVIAAAGILIDTWRTDQLHKTSAQNHALIKEYVAGVNTIVGFGHQIVAHDKWSECNQVNKTYASTVCGPPPLYKVGSTLTIPILPPSLITGTLLAWVPNSTATGGTK